jgi:hypothetical protein
LTTIYRDLRDFTRAGARWDVNECWVSPLIKSGVSVPTGSLLEPGKIALETLCGQDFLFGIERCGRRLGTGRPATRRRCPSASVDAFGRSASRPLFQGARRQRGKGFSVVIVVSDAGPVHLSAGSPSTGCDNLPRKDAIAPKAVTSAGADHTLLQVPRWTSAGYSRAHVQCGSPQEP